MSSAISPTHAEIRRLTLQEAVAQDYGTDSTLRS